MQIFFKENIVWLRKQGGLSQQESATELGLKRSSYANYESGHTEPSFDILAKFVLKYGISAQDLLYSDLSNVQLNKTSSDSKNVHLNVHPSVHLTGKNEPHLTIAGKDETQIKNGNPRPLLISVDTGDIYKRIVDLEADMEIIKKKLRK